MSSKYTDSQKRASIKYLLKQKEIRFRVHPEEYKRMQEAADLGGYESMRSFFLDAIYNAVEKIEKNSKP